MTLQSLNYLIFSLLAAVLLLAGFTASSAPAEDLADDSKLPDIDYLIRVARGTTGWQEPLRGAPQTRYIIDHATGKSYLVEVDHWGYARVLGEF